MPQDKRLYHTTIIPCVTPPYISFNIGVTHGIIVVCHNLLSCGIYTTQVSQLHGLHPWRTCCIYTTVPESLLLTSEWISGIPDISTPSCCLCHCVTFTDHRKRKKLSSVCCGETRDVLVVTQRHKQQDGVLTSIPKLTISFLVPSYICKFSGAAI